MVRISVNPDGTVEIKTSKCTESEVMHELYKVEQELINNGHIHKLTELYVQIYRVICEVKRSAK